jgi:hypothetical protein
MMPPKCRPLEIYLSSTSRNTTLHGDELRDQNIEAVDQVINDDMDGDNISDSNQEDEIHRILIQDMFAPMDEDNQDDSHDVDPLLEKSRQPLYEGSTINLLSAILLLVNLKVLNGLSNTCLTQILRYFIC